MSSKPWFPNTPSRQLGDREVGSEQAALALVESPAQLPNVIELGQREDDLAGLKIAVLAPAAGLTRMQLRSMMGLARDAGHAVSWHEPRLGGMAVARTVRALAGDLSGVQRQADRYFAHRKEAGWKLDLIERIGIKVVRPALPPEIIARRGPTGRTVVSFPSTVVHTLPIVLAARAWRSWSAISPRGGTNQRLPC